MHLYPRAETPPRVESARNHPLALMRQMTPITPIGGNEMKLYYDGKFVGEIITNHSMSVDDACEMLGIDVATDEYDPGLFEMVW